MAPQLLFVILGVVVSSYAEVHPSYQVRIHHLGSAVLSGQTNLHHASSSNQHGVAAVHHGSNSVTQDHGLGDNVAEPTLFRHDVATVGSAGSKDFQGSSQSHGNNHVETVSSYSHINDHEATGTSHSHGNNHVNAGSSFSQGNNHVNAGSSFSQGNNHISDERHFQPNALAHQAPNRDHLNSYDNPSVPLHNHINSAPVNHNSPAVNHYDSSNSVGNQVPAISALYSAPDVGVSHVGPSSSYNDQPRISDHHSVSNNYGATHSGNVGDFNRRSNIVAHPSLSYLPPSITSSSSNIVNHIAPPQAIRRENVLRPIPVVVDYPAPAQSLLESVHVAHASPAVHAGPLFESTGYDTAVAVPVEVNAAVAPVIIPAGSVQSQYHSQDELGQYAFGYQNGESSRDETRDVYGHVRGSYSYVDAHGQLQSQHYVADDKGFRVTGTNLPVHVTDEH